MLHLKAIWDRSSPSCGDSCNCEPPPISEFVRPSKNRSAAPLKIDDDFPLLALPKPITQVSNAFEALQIPDADFPTLATPDPVCESVKHEISNKMAEDLEGWAHRVNKAPDKKIKHSKSWKLRTDEDVAKFGK